MADDRGRFHRGRHITAAPAAAVDLGFGPRRGKGFPIPQSSLRQQRPQASQVEEGRAESNPRNHRSCWFMLASVSGYFNLEEMSTGHWALRSFCLW